MNSKGKNDQKVIKIVAVSDTHNKLQDLSIQDFPPADFFVHAGDITNWSRAEQFQNFREILKKLPYKHKIVIGGNHDFGLMPSQSDYQQCFKHFQLPQQWRVNPLQQRKKLQQVCTYLEHDFVQINGVKFFGSPYVESPFIQGFYVLPKNGYQVWTKLPQKIDVLITHMPPNGILDKVVKKPDGVGSKRLRQAIERTNPKVHIFGHIHQSHGHTRVNKTDFYNVAMLDEEYNIKSKPTLIEFNNLQPKKPRWK